MTEAVEKRPLPDGLEALRRELHLGDIMRLIERTARWVAPETFQLLPVWFPEYARRTLFYKANWSEPQANKNKQSGVSEHKREGNRYASIALTSALGLRSHDRPNWSCCHIWGTDDPKFQESNKIVKDHRYYSCVANMVLLPTPLKAFTDSMIEVKVMLRICARNLYGWYCEDETLKAAVATIETWADWSAYPESWPRTGGEKRPPGVIRLDDEICSAARARVERIKRDLREPRVHYPTKEVLAALSFWKKRMLTMGEPTSLLQQVAL